MRFGASSDHRRADWIARTLAIALALAAAAWTQQSRSQTVRSRPDSTTVSELLRPPGQDDSYGQSVDWSSLPPWQQTSFFGLRAQGQVFAFVVDASGSMGNAARLARAKAELRRCVGALRSPQRFVVIFYNEEPLPLASGEPLPASAAGKARLASWLRQIDADGATDPRGAMALAIGMKPDAIFLLSDGEFPAGTAEAVARVNRNRVPIHAVDMTGGAAGTQLRRIAADSAGQYATRE